MNSFSKLSKSNFKDGEKPASAEILTQVEKIIRSSVFARSRRMQRFLKFTVEQALTGEGESAKEYSIALAVFDKPQSFDPRLDPIVRVEAGRLRSKLREYYDGPGRLDPVRITYLKRSYLPHFRYQLAEQDGPDPLFPVTSDALFADATLERAEFYRGTQEVKAIGVLPFINLSVSRKQDYFSEAITAEIINVLNQTLPLNVVSRTSVLRFKDTEEDIREIARQLGVNAILEGSVRVEGKRVRVVAELADASNGYQLWSQIYDRKITDIFDVQKALALAIAQALKVKLQKVQFGAAELFGTGNSDAYHLYLRGRHVLRSGLRADLKSAVNLYRKAIAIDREYALAYAGLADAYAAFSWSGVMLPKSCWEKSAAMAQKALQINPALGHARIASAHWKASFAWKWDEAENEFRRSLKLVPAYAGGHQLYALACLLPQGRFAHAEDEVERACGLTPSSASLAADLGWVFYCKRQYALALDQLTKSSKLDPLFYRSYLYMGYAHEQQGNLEEALSSYMKARELSGAAAVADGAIGRCMARMRKKDVAWKILRDLVLRSKKTYVSAIDIANICLGLGNIEHACEWLEKALAQRCPRMTYLNVDPAYDSLKSGPAFFGFLREMRLDNAHSLETA
jgi:TolB-like protein/Tfp pilus assembly protein PilF